MSRWTFQRVTGSPGRYQIVFSKPNGRSVDVTYFRGVPTQLQSYSSGDPFGDAAAVISFPQIGGYDDLDGEEVGSWLADFSQVDIYWIEYEQSLTAGTEIDPLTNQRTLRPSGVKTKIWEGYVASMELSLTETDAGLSVQCQGALYQLDRYLEKPAYPPRPVPHEKLLAGVFSQTRRPHLRVKPLIIEWPEGWAKTVPAYTTVNVYTPDAAVGDKYTGYSTRSTGTWDRALTGFAQDLLAVMYTEDDTGVTAGDQWTIRKDPERQPVLHVRRRFRTPDLSFWFGQAGVTGSFSRDTTQVANIIYGEGTGTDGSGWRNAVISSDGSRTDYLPLAYSRAVYPEHDNKAFDRGEFVAEGFYKYGSGFGLDQAVASATKSLARDQRPGWAGDITLKVDPPEMSRWAIKAGMTLNLQGFAGSGEQGVHFHVAQVEANPLEGTVKLTLDTRYRDLLNLEEARVRARDPLTPSKMLQINRRSVMIEDLQAPWDYTAGSGFIPRASTQFHANRPNNTVFPWASWLQSHPPYQYGQYYVRVNADRPDRASRWTIGKDVPILMSQKGTIRRTEIVAVDIEGNIVPVPFHFSLYYVPETTYGMPRDANGPSPFLPNAFESVTAEGGQFPVGNYFAPPPTMVIGWGNADQPAGYSPGRKSDGGPPTGIMVDEATWSFDCTNNPNFAKDALPGQVIPQSVVTLYGAFYAEYTEPVYFIGRMFRAEPGTG